MARPLKRKGQYFNIMIAIGFMIAMTTIFIGLHAKYKNLTKEPLGTKQAELVKSYQESEKFQLYLEIAASYAADEAFKKVTTNPGEYLVDNRCGTYGGGETGVYALWENMDELCSPSKSSFEQAFEEQFNIELKKYLDAYPGTIKRNDYEQRLQKMKEQEIKPIDLAAQDYVRSEESKEGGDLTGEVPDG